jgi:hypothetical protein
MVLSVGFYPFRLVGIKNPFYNPLKPRKSAFNLFFCALSVFNIVFCKIKNRLKVKGIALIVPIYPDDALEAIIHQNSKA